MSGESFDGTGPREEWAIELFRGIAAAMVVAAHYVPVYRASVGLPAITPIGFAYTGVDLFFVLTGYVFTPLLRSPRFEWRAYAARRFFRLYPLYFVALVVYAAVAHANGRPLKYLGEHLVFLHTWQTFEIAGYYNIAFWSLPPEIEYYLALPLLAALLRGRWRWMLVIAPAALVLHVAVSHGANVQVAQPSLAAILAFHLPGVGIEFLLGVGAWHLSRAAATGAARAALIATGAAAWIAGARIFGASAPGGTGGLHAVAAALNGHFGLLAALAYALLVAGFTAHWRDHRRATLAGAGLWLGSLSYGVYLFHNAWLQILAPQRAAWGTGAYLLACVAATGVTAFVLHRVVEAPLRAYGRRLAQGLRPAPLST